LAKAEPPNSYYSVSLAVLSCGGEPIGTYSEGSGSISGSSPSPAAVQAKALVGNDLEDTAALEGLGVCLSLNLQDIEGKKDDLANTNQTIYPVSPVVS
jgi:hypothetical protein